MEMGAMRADPIDMNIGIDNVAAMYELTEMVIKRGYQNIGLLCANQEQWILDTPALALVQRATGQFI